MKRELSNKEIQALHEKAILDALRTEPKGLETQPLIRLLAGKVSKHMLPIRLQRMRAAKLVVRVGCSIRTRHCLPQHAEEAEQDVVAVMSRTAAGRNALAKMHWPPSIPLSVESKAPLDDRRNVWVSSWPKPFQPCANSVFQLGTFVPPDQPQENQCKPT